LTNDFAQTLEAIRLENRQFYTENEFRDLPKVKSETKIKEYVLESLEEYEGRHKPKESAKSLIFQNLKLKKQLTNMEQNLLEKTEEEDPSYNSRGTPENVFQFTNDTDFKHKESNGTKFNKNLETLFLKSVEHEHKEMFFQKNRIINDD
jgi:hypothetical protein